MEVRVFPSAADAARACAAHLAAALAARPAQVLGLPTGRTFVPVYQALTGGPGVDLSRVTTFNLDELCGLAAGHPASFRAYMERHLFGPASLARERIHFLRGEAEDAEAECARYDAALEAAGGLDLVLLGLGSNGHLAFNEPGEALQARSHRARLESSTRAALAPLFGGDAAQVPAEALTLGMGSLLRSREALLLAFGAGKARAVAQMVEGPVTPRCPASFLQLHRQARVWLDPAAAGALGGR